MTTSPRPLLLFFSAADVFCPVQLDDFPAAEMYALPCGHWASAQAWRGYLLSALDEDPVRAVLSRCLATGCREALRPSTWERFLGGAQPRDARALARFREFFARSYVAGCRSIASCPCMIMQLGGGGGGGGGAAGDGAPAAAASSAAAGAPAAAPAPAAPAAAGAGAGGAAAAAAAADDAPVVTYRECDQVVSWPSGHAMDVQCGRGHVFCFSCKAVGGHRPADCAEMADFMKSVGGSILIGDAIFVKKTFSACPNKKCGLPTERSTGCNKVVCVSCHTAYCWICKRFPYEEHHAYPKARARQVRPS
jgi:hypothetical protein